MKQQKKRRKPIYLSDKEKDDIRQAIIFTLKVADNEPPENDKHAEDLAALMSRLIKLNEKIKAL